MVTKPVGNNLSETFQGLRGGTGRGCRFPWGCHSPAPRAPKGIFGATSGSKRNKHVLMDPCPEHGHQNQVWFGRERPRWASGRAQQNGRAGHSGARRAALCRRPRSRPAGGFPGRRTPPPAPLRRAAAPAPARWGGSPGCGPSALNKRASQLLAAAPALF